MGSEMQNFTEAQIDEYLENYVLEGVENEAGAEGYYTPNERERILIKDAILGLIAEMPTQAEPAGTAEARSSPPVFIQRKDMSNEQILTANQILSVLRQAMDAAKLLPGDRAYLIGHFCNAYNAQIPAPAQAEPVADELDGIKPMTAKRAAFFMERFRKEEKLLGPNEQAAVAFVIAMLERETVTQAEPVAVGVPSGMVLVPADLLKDALESVDDYRSGRDFGPPDRKLIGRLKAAIEATPPAPASEAPTQAGGCQASGEVSEAMVTAYLKANDAYWRMVDDEPTKLGKWRNGTPSEAVRVSLLAALAVAPPAGRTLTDEQIVQMANGHLTELGWFAFEPADFITCVRAILAASSTTAGTQPSDAPTQAEPVADEPAPSLAFQYRREQVAKQTRGCVTK